MLKLINQEDMYKYKYFSDKLKILMDKLPEESQVKRKYDNFLLNLPNISLNQAFNLPNAISNLNSFYNSNLDSTELYN